MSNEFTIDENTQGVPCGKVMDSWIFIMEKLFSICICLFNPGGRRLNVWRDAITKQKRLAFNQVEILRRSEVSRN